METVEEFLAHACAMESEVAERYEEMADSMAIHNNIEVADLLRRLSHEGQKHAAEIHARAEGKDLPRIAPWDFKWGDGEPPETPTMEDVHYLMTPYHALDMARKFESAAHDFYAAVADQSEDPEICRLAREFAEEEAGHVKLLNEWISRYPEPDEGWDYDPDPPTMPE
ncbi:MAG: ferritin family protein [Hyphomicrobiales bacterium]|nr:ferritin family protein [Hyphomicrobiales bacterium]